MTIKTLLGAAALATTTAFTATAAPINLVFSFDGVMGTFYGLDDQLTGNQAASSFDLVGQLDTYTGVDDPLLTVNNFLFISGTLDAAFFHLNSSALGDFGIAELFIFEITSGPGGRRDGRVFELGPRGMFLEGGIAFSQQPVAPVPLPAAAVLLLSGLAGVAGLKRRKKHTA